MSSTSSPKDNSHFEMICLEPEQKALFQKIADAHKKIAGEGRRMFFISDTASGTKLIHPHFPGDEVVSLKDIEEFDRNNLISLVSGMNFSITSNGMAYYEFLQTKKGGPAEQLESAILKYLENNAFKLHYPRTYNKWSLAAKVLFSSDSEDDMTAIVHDCCGAIQIFADELIQMYRINCPINDRNKEIAKIRFVIGVLHKDIKKSQCDLDAILAYWEKFSAQIQRQEHSKKVTKDYTRRVVFQSAVIMFEVDKVLRLG